MNDWLPRAFSDFDGYVATLPEVQRNAVNESFRWSPNPDEDKKRLLGVAYAADKLGIDSEEVSQHFETDYMHRVALDPNGLGMVDPPRDVNEFFDAASKRVKRDGEIAVVANEAAQRAAVDALGSDYLPSFSKWQAEAKVKPGYDPQADAEYKRAFDATQTKVAPYKKFINDSVNTLRSNMSEAGTQWKDFDFKAAADHILAIPAEDRPFVLDAIGSLGAQKEDKRVFMDKIALAFDRGAADLGSKVAGAASDLLTSKYEMTPQVVKDALSSKEDQAAVNAGITEGRNRRVVAQQIRDIATGKISPLTSGNIVGRGLIGASESLPMTAAAFVPYAGPAALVAYFKEDSYLNLRANSPELSDAQAQAISTISAPIQAVTEVISDRLLANRLPSLHRALNSPVLSATGIAARFVGQAALGTATEFAEEKIQNATDPVLQKIGHALSEDMPDVANWNQYMDRFKGGNLDLIAQILPLSLIGAGGATFESVAYSKALGSSPLLLEAAGYQKADAAKIADAVKSGDTKTAESLMRHGWREIAAGREAGTVEGVTTEAAQQVMADFRELEAKEQALKDAATAHLEEVGATLPLRKTAEGWTLTMEDGSAATFATHQEADEARWSHLAETHSIKPAEQIREFIGQAEKAAETGREFVYEFDPKQLTTERAVAEGLTTPEAIAKRSEQAKALSGDDQAYDVARATAAAQGREQSDVSGVILGSNKDEFKNGVLRSTMRLYQGATPATIVEETLETSARRLLSNNRRDWMEQALREWESVSGDTLFRKTGTLDDDDLIEAWSHFGQSYFLARSKKGDGKALDSWKQSNFRQSMRSLMGTKLSSAMDAMATFLRSVFKRAAKIQKARRDGVLSQELEQEIARQLGLGEAFVHGREAMREAANIASEASDEGLSYTPPSDAPLSFVPTKDTKETVLPDGARLVGPASFSLIAYHGTPHKVDKFSTEKIGTGEGAQAYGWGLYFAENKSVGEQYKSNLANKLMRGDGSTFKASTTAELAAQDALQKTDGDYDKARETAKTEDFRSLAILDGWQHEGVTLAGELGNLYTVELLPDESEFLDWDKPLAEQSEKVRAAIEQEFGKLAQMDMSGGDWHAWITRDDTDAKTLSGDLARIGIKGIRYLDGGSRNAGDGTRNYVIFDESLVRILEENGKPVEARSFSLSRVTPAQYSGPGEGQAFSLSRAVPADTSNVTEMPDGARITSGESQYNFSLLPENKVAPKEAFASAVQRFGLTRDIAEAGYILPDGRLLDFTGRADAGYRRVGDTYLPQAGERDYMKGSRGTDHREVEWTGMPEYKETWMPMVEFMRMGAVRIDRSGAITLHGRAGITAAQKSRLSDLLIESGGEVFLDMEDDDGKRASVEMSGAKISKLAGYIQRWKDGWTPDDVVRSFSFLPGELPAQLESMFDPFKSPEAKARVGMVAKNRVAKIALEWEQVAKQQKKVREIEAQRKEMQARLEDENLAKLTPETHAAFNTPEEQAKAVENPVVAMLVKRDAATKRFKGRLMSYSAAMAKGLDVADQYDDRIAVPAWMYGGTLTPNQAAKELHDENLINGSHASDLWSALDSAFIGAQKTREGIEKAKAAMREAKSSAKAEADAWAAGQRKEQEQRAKALDRGRLLQALRVLDASISALPMEIRGKIGGYVKLASLDTDEARVDAIADRVEKIEREMEKWLRKEYRELIGSALEKNKSTRSTRGQMTGRTVASVTEQVNYAADFVGLSQADQDKEIAHLESIIEDTKSTAEQIDGAINKLGVAELFYDFGGQGAESLEVAHKWLKETIQKGRDTKNVLDEERRNSINRLKVGGVTDVLGRPVSSQIDAENVTEEIKGSTLRRVVENVKAFINSVLPTTAQQLEDVFGVESGVVAEFMPRIWSAANLSTDIKTSIEAKRKAMLARVFKTSSTIQQIKALTKLQQARRSGVVVQEGRKTEEVRVPVEILERLADGKISAKDAGLSIAEVKEALDQWASASVGTRGATIERVTNPGSANELTMSEMEGLNYLLHWNQDAVRARMESHGWSDASIAQLQSFLSDEAKEIGRWMSEVYLDAGRSLVDPVYRRLFHAPLPFVKNFAPTFYNIGGNDAAMAVDQSQNSSGMMASFTKGRKPHGRSVRRVDAMTAFLSHFEHVAHWVSFAELTRDMKAVLLSTEVQNAVITKYGPSAAASLTRRMKSIETQGNNQAWSLHEIDGMFSRLNQARAFKVLAFRISPIVKQTSAVFNPLLADIPAADYALGMGRLLGGKLDVSGMWKSDVVRRRIDGGFSAEARLAMQASANGPVGAVAIQLMQRGMMPMQYTDGGWTAVGAAIGFDYYRSRALAARESPQMAEQTANKAVERMIAISAQPADLVNRSLIEGSPNPFVKAAWMFASEARKTLAIEYYAAKRLLTGRSKNKAMDFQRVAVAHFVMGAVTQLMSGLLALALGDDDEREREWSADEWAAAILAGPINGLFVVGDGLNYMLRAALRLRVFKSLPGYVKTAEDAKEAATHVDALLSGDGEEILKEMDRLSAAIGSVSSAFVGPAAQAPDVLLGNPLREVAKILDKK